MPWFAQIQAAAENESDESSSWEDEDANTLVFSGLRYEDYKAIQRFADGSIVVATSYSEGPAGFVVAHFPSGPSLQLELPNKYHKDGKLLMNAPIDPAELEAKDKKKVGFWP